MVVLRLPTPADAMRSLSRGKLSPTCVCLDPGAFRSGLLGILAGPPRQKGARYVERCDACEVFDSDEAACREYARVHGGRCSHDSDLKVVWSPL